MNAHRDQWFGGRTYAQHGDDLAVLNIFKRLGIEKPSYLDVGAYHPFDLSNTALLYERGSRGINVEPNEALISAFLKARPEDVNLCVGVAPVDDQTIRIKDPDDPEQWVDIQRVDKILFHHVAGDPGRNTFDPDIASALGIVRSVPVLVMTLNQIVDRHACGIWPDLLSLDIEGLDIEVLRGAEFGAMPPKVAIVEADNGSGDTSHELSAIMAAKGFTLHSWAGSNMIFVRTALQALVWGD